MLGGIPEALPNASRCMCVQVDAAALACLQRLQSLELVDGKLTDDSLAHLDALTNLTHLCIDRNPALTSGGLRHLSGLQRLTSFLADDCPGIDHT